jgi:hypothetical protein
MAALVLWWALLVSLPSQQTAPTSNASAPAAASAASAGSASLDFEFFKTKVQPIFLTKRPGLARCAACHASVTAPAVFQLQPLSTGSTTWTEEESRKNFDAARRLVIPGNVKSPLLMHPLAEDAGGDFFHSGGKQFHSQDDAEWQTLKAWVLGQSAGR